MRRAAALALLLAGCGAGDLDPAAVTSIPPGGATGSALSGSYRFRRITTSCRGDCGGTTQGGFSVSVCNVGQVKTFTAEVSQEDGRLRAEIEGDRPALYAGAVEPDGRFVLGAYAQQGGTLDITVRTEGRIAADRIEGTARSRTAGLYARVDFDCWGTYDITPARPGD